MRLPDGGSACGGSTCVLRSEASAAALRGPDCLYRLMHAQWC